MKNPSVKTRTTNTRLLAELQELHKTVDLLAKRIPTRPASSTKSPLPSYTIPANDSRYLTEEVAAAFSPLTPTLCDHHDTIEFCESHFAELIKRGLQEEFHVLTLNGSHRVIRTHQATMGLANATQIHPREVFRPAILDGAVAVILVHNHPSGDPQPSDADHMVTSKLKEAGEILGIKVLDHIIVARHGSLTICDE